MLGLGGKTTLSSKFDSKGVRKMEDNWETKSTLKTSIESKFL